MQRVVLLIDDDRTVALTRPDERPADSTLEEGLKLSEDYKKASVGSNAYAAEYPASPHIS
jgi:hypothetical protein